MPKSMTYTGRKGLWHDDSKWAPIASKCRGKRRMWCGPESGDHVTPRRHVGDRRTLGLPCGQGK